MTVQATRLLQLFMFLSCCSSTRVFAQVKQIAPGPNQPWLYEFAVDPAPEPRPALKYQLLPERTFRKPGNAAMSYYRALFLFNAHSEKDRKEFADCQDYSPIVETAAAVATNNLSDPITTDRVKVVISAFADVFAELKIAANRESCDWGLALQEKNVSEWMNLQTGELQLTRQLVRLIQMKARVAIVNRDYDEAFRVIQLGFQLGRDIAQCPLLITGLIGVAACARMHDLLMEIISQPQSPNLYWAIALLPNPMIDIRPSLEEDLNLAFKFSIVREAEQAHSKEEWHRLLSEPVLVYRQLHAGGPAKLVDNGGQDSSEGLLSLISREHPRATIDLARFGFKPAQISEMPIAQVIALHDATIARYKRDQLLKLIYLPYPQAAPLIHSILNPPEANDESKRLSDLKSVIPLFDDILPSVDKALAATIRLECRLAGLRAIEAIRMYAAANDREMPSSLSEITLAPIPPNPMTGQAIGYRLEKDTAILEFQSPDPAIINFAEIIRVTLRK